MTAGQKRSSRLFFALWPPDSVRQSVLEQREALGAISRRRVPVHNYHLTLLFLGNQDAGLMGEIQAIIDLVSKDAGEPFDLRLDRWGYFDSARVVWLGARAPRPCVALVDALTSAADSTGLALRPSPFVPHLTVFRQVTPPFQPPEIEPIDWSVRDFSLIESIPGRPYQVLRTWSLE